MRLRSRYCCWAIFFLVGCSFITVNGSSGQEGKECADGSKAPCRTLPGILTPPTGEYTPEAKKAKVQGSVILTVTITAEGLAQDIVVEKSLGYGLDEKAVEQLKKMKFRPGTVGGKPAACRVKIAVTFKLKD